ncbi:hypothetical protein AX279_22445 [Pseudomonas sp. J237]|nr:hypothetical protein AX279_22445 [Pseudomonas sp. J237]
MLINESGVGLLQPAKSQLRDSKDQHVDKRKISTTAQEKGRSLAHDYVVCVITAAAIVFIDV